MEFRFETAYNQEAITAMAKAIRKTARKKRSRRSHVFGVIVIILAVLLTLPIGDKEFVFDIRTVITWIAVVIILCLFLAKVMHRSTIRKVSKGGTIEEFREFMKEVTGKEIESV